MRNASSLPVVVASRSAGKAMELVAQLRDGGVAATSLLEMALPFDPAEDHLEVHESFEENARAKALYFARRFPEHVVLADDSGLEVDALGGRPGVHSRRWAQRDELDGADLDRANNEFLLGELARAGALDASSRSARYVCAVVAMRAADGLEISARGVCEGRILTSAEGSGGFGYDPLFWSTDLGESFGNASAEAKAGVSHRGRALRALLADLRQVDGIAVAG